MKESRDSTKLNIWLYFVIGLIVAFLVERGAAASGDSKLFQNPAWPIGFFIWYGFFTIS